MAKSILMTEHGRVPVCTNEAHKHEAHCHHAHFLLFGTKQNIEPEASKYFAQKNKFSSLNSALGFASEIEHYYLLSPSVDQYIIFSEGFNIPRQFFRLPC